MMPCHLCDDDVPPPVDMDLRQLAIRAGLTEETPEDTAHAMFKAMGLKRVEPTCPSCGAGKPGGERT